MKKYQIYYHKVYNLAAVAELCPPIKLRKPEVVIPEPLPERKPFIRISANVGKRSGQNFLDKGNHV
jgi:hypothetical protein